MHFSLLLGTKHLLARPVYKKLHQNSANSLHLRKPAGWHAQGQWVTRANKASHLHPLSSLPLSINQKGPLQHPARIIIKQRKKNMPISNLLLSQNRSEHHLWRILTSLPQKTVAIWFCLHFDVRDWATQDTRPRWLMATEQVVGDTC